jgi:hypothetical protein
VVQDDSHAILITENMEVILQHLLDIVVKLEIPSHSVDFYVGHFRQCTLQLHKQQDDESVLLSLLF